MVEVICDTNFLIHLATKRIKNISSLETEVGPIQFVVPDIVVKELQKLGSEDKKQKLILSTLNFIKKLKKISITGEFADKALINYVKLHGGIIGTLDKELKDKIKNSGGSIMSLSNDRIVLES